MSDEQWPRDPRAAMEAEMEEELVTRAMEPWRAELTPEEREGMRLVLDVFVTTHPAMRSMLERRAREDAGRAAGTATDAQAVTVPDASGVVARGGAAEGPGGKAGKAGKAGKVGKAGGAR